MHTALSLFLPLAFLSPQSILHQWDGSETHDMLGAAISTAGDLNGDGVDDVLVGSPGFDAGNGVGHGKVSLFSGADGSLLQTILGPEGGQFGCAIAGGKDVTGDGIPDYLVGAKSASFGGLVYLFSGATHQWVETLQTGGVGNEFGAALVWLENPSGEPEGFVIGSPGSDGGGYPEAGSVSVWKLTFGALGQYSDWLFNVDGSGAAHYLGDSVASPGDLNGDGVLDILVGAPGYDSIYNDAGIAYTFSGLDGSLLDEFHGEYSAGRMGDSVAGVRDLNGDLVGDFIIGEPGANHGTVYQPGRAKVFSGATGAILYTVSGTGPRDNCGEFVSGLPDMDVDGVPDFAVGSTTYDVASTASDEGAIRVFSGATGDIIFVANGQYPLDNLGFVAAVGDLNGDGFPNLLGGAGNADAGGVTNSGSAFVFAYDAPFTFTQPELIAGGTATLHTLGGVGDLVVFGASLQGPGPTYLAWINVSVSLSSPIHNLGSVAPDISGQAFLAVAVPAGLVGSTVWLQALERVGTQPWTPSNGVQAIVQ